MRISKTEIFLQFYRLSKWLELIIFRRALKLRTQCFYLISLGIRVSKDGAPQEGADIELDKQISIATWYLTSPEYSDIKFPSDSVETNERVREMQRQNSLEYAARKEACDSLISEALKNPFVGRWVAQYFATEAYLDSFFKDREKTSTYYHKRALEFSSDYVEVVPGSISKLSREAKKSHSSARKILSDREAMKISIDPSIVLPLIGVFSFLFVITGYLFNFFYLGSFGVDVTRYFDLTDYVSSSIEHIWIIFFGVLLSTLFVFLGMHHASRKPTAQIEHERRGLDWFAINVALIFVLNILAGLLLGGRSLHMFLSFNIIYGGFFITTYLADRFFRNRTVAIFMFTMLFSYVSGMYGHTARQIFEVHDTGFDHAFCDSLRSDVDNRIASGFDDCTVKYLASSSSYLFVYDQGTNTAVALKKDMFGAFVHNPTFDFVQETAKIRTEVLRYLPEFFGDKPSD